MFNWLKRKPKEQPDPNQVTIDDVESYAEWYAVSSNEMFRRNGGPWSGSFTNTNWPQWKASQSFRTFLRDNPQPFRQDFLP